MIRRLLSGKDAAAPSVQRWWHQRLSAVALLPLSLWFMYDMVTLVSPEYTAVRAWLATPSTMLLFILLTPALFYHAFIGIHEVIEDYITNERCKRAANALARGSAALGAFASIVAITAINMGL